MLILLFCLFCQFNDKYNEFLQSPRSELIFTNLTRGRNSIFEFSDDPVILWFWRNRAQDPIADTLLKKLHLRRNYYLSAVLRWEAKEAEDLETKINKLNLAVHFDSSAIENLLSFAVLSVKKRNLEPLIAAFSLPVFSDFRNQIFLITNILLLLFMSLFMCAFTYIVTKTIYYLPLLSHRIDPQRHNRIKGIIGFVILLIPVLVLRNIYLIFICYSILLIFVFSLREKNWLRLITIILSLIFVLSLPLDSFAKFLQKKSRSYQIYEMVYYDSSVMTDVVNETEKELLAYSLKQHGKWEEAMSIYEELFYSGNREIAVVNNLANIYFLYDESPKAETLYNLAFRIEDRGEPYFNMGLLKLKNIEYSESSRYMDEARRRNFSAAHTSPIDIRPTRKEFYQIILSERLKLLGFFKPIYFVPFLIIFCLSFIPFGFYSPFYCSTCGRAICKKCFEEVGEEIMCRECFTKFKSSENVEMEESLRYSVGKGRKRINTFIAYLVNVIIPGAGLIYLGKNFVGLVIVLFVMFGYVPLLFLKGFIKPSGWVALSVFPILLVIAIVISFLAYVYSFYSIRSAYGD